VERNDLEKSSLEFQMIFGEPLDSRGPLQFEDEPADENQVQEVFAKAADEQLAKNAGVPSISTAVPSLDEIVGWSDGMASFVKAKRIEVSPEEMNLVKRGLSKASSGPGRIRLEKTVIDGELWVIQYDHLGQEIGCYQPVEDAA
jgi:hypothetical protein